MKVLLDHCIPRPFERLLPGHEVRHTSRLGWGDLANGRLLTAAEDQGYEVLVTIDQGLRYQQNLVGRQLALVVLQSLRNDIPTLLPMTSPVIEALESSTPGAVTIVSHPNPPRKGRRQEN